MTENNNVVREKIEKEKEWLTHLQSSKTNAIAGVKFIPNEVLIWKSKNKIEEYYQFLKKQRSNEKH